MTQIPDIQPSNLVTSTATLLKSITVIEAPQWSKYAKTGSHKERPPIQKDWWYVRAAAILRTVYVLGPIGTEKMRTKYGGKKNRGMAAEIQRKGSGSVIRTILQQLEKAELVQKGQRGHHKGRIVTGKGESLLNKAAKASVKNDQG